MLLVGETGTGKELVARTIHAAGRRRNGPFVPVNCGALQETLLESELFGHERGAFTGAIKNKTGLVEAARGGTLFLDEIEEMSPRLQVALLRFLEDGEFRPWARPRPRAATHGSLQRATPGREGVRGKRRLRDDLRYRLDVVRIGLPALRERPEDLRVLVQDLIQRVSQRLHEPPVEVTPEALVRLETSPWPGNVRELRNEVERWFAHPGGGSQIGPKELSVIAASRPGAPNQSRYGAAVRTFKAQLVRSALEAAGGNKSRAAADLGLHRSNLSRLTRELEIE